MDEQILEIENENTCQICMTELDSMDVVKLEQCEHWMHKACLNQYIIESAMNWKIPIICLKCKIPLNENFDFWYLSLTEK